MWEEIGLIGQDKLLSKEILPRVRGKGRFYLTGQRGIGKTAVMEWACKQCPGPKAFISTSLSPRDFLIELCLQFGIEPNLNDNELSIERKLSRMTRQSLEKLVVKSDMQGKIFIDELEKIKPTAIKILSFLATQHQLFFAGIPPFRDEVKKYLWGATEIGIKRLEKKDTSEIAKRVSKKTGKIINIEQIANAADGIPGKTIQMALGEIEWKRPARTKEEEINIAPVLLVIVAATMFIRYISVGMNMMDLYILGGLGASLGIFARFFIYRMAGRK